MCGFKFWLYVGATVLHGGVAGRGRASLGRPVQSHRGTLFVGGARGETLRDHSCPVPRIQQYLGNLSFRQGNTKGKMVGEERSLKFVVFAFFGGSI